MDLAFNAAAPFTRWVVEADLLQEPFVVIDIGVQGGEHPRWNILGDYLVLHGLDPIKEVIETLQRKNAGRPSRHYHWLAAGSQDDWREFYFNTADPYSSSFYPHGGDRFRPDGTHLDERRRVEMRRLDSLLADGTLPRADFIKVDVEGFEQDVFTGGGELLSFVLGVETESNLNISPTYPRGHFPTIHEILLRHGLLVFDLNFNRIPRATFQAALRRQGLRPITDQDSVGSPATLNVLFCRDLIAEADQPQNYAAPPSAPHNVDGLIKSVIIFELHGLSDIALDTTARFADSLGTRLDVEKAVTLLADPNCRGYSKTLRHFTAAARRRATAPLRAVRSMFSARLA